MVVNAIAFVAATWTSLNLSVTLFEVQVEEPGGLQSMRSQRVRHDWATKHVTLFGLEWLFSCLRCLYSSCVLKKKGMGKEGREREERTKEGQQDGKTDRQKQKKQEFATPRDSWMFLHTPCLCETARCLQSIGQPGSLAPSSHPPLHEPSSPLTSIGKFPSCHRNELNVTSLHWKKLGKK